MDAVIAVENLGLTYMRVSPLKYVLYQLVFRVNLHTAASQRLAMADLPTSWSIEATK